jgi:GNAT superfamily N-acetyltransferase
MMLNSHVLAAVADEQRRSMYAEAEAGRRVRGLLHRRQPAELANVLIRPIESTDATGLRDGFARLGPQSRQLRFLGPKRELTDREVSYFTEVDHVTHEALVAVEPAAGIGLGVARYIRDPVDPETADVAVTVVDEWQGRGVGTLLVDRLGADARAAGILRVHCQVRADNAPSLALCRRLKSAMPAAA